MQKRLQLLFFYGILKQNRRKNMRLFVYFNCEFAIT